MSIALGLAYGLVDALVDAVFFSGGSFLESAITHVTPHELYTRSATMAIVLSFGLVMARILARRQRREAELEVLQGMRDAVWRMSGPGDFVHVVEALGDGLETLVFPVHGYAVNLVEREEPLRVVYYEASTRDRTVSVSEKRRGDDIVLRMWRRGDTTYRPDIARRDPAGERDDIERRFGERVRSVLDVPFSHGTLAVNSHRAGAFSDEHIRVLQAMAGVVSSGFQRLVDLRSLRQNNRELQDKDRLLDAFHEIGSAALGSLDRDEMLDRLARQILRAGIFRSLMVALVDERQESVEVVRNFVCALGEDGLPQPGGAIVCHDDVVGFRYPLDDDNITARVARTGELAVVDGPDERFDPRAPAVEPRSVSYFIPVKKGDRTLGVLATGSTAQDKDETLTRIRAMQPLLDQVAIALDHARLYEAARREITRRREAEEAMRQSQREFQDLYDNAPDMYVSVDAKTARILRCNQTLAAALGYAQEELVGRSVFSVYHPDCREQVKEAFRSFVETGEIHDAELQLKRKDGSRLDVSVNSSAVRDDRGLVLYSRSAWRDITEHKRLERELTRLERLRATGELAGGVSHNLNNILTAVLGPAQFLLRRSDDPGIRREAEAILAAGRRARDLVLRLGQAVRPDAESPLEPVSVGEHVRQVVELSRPRWRDEPQARGVAVDIVTDLADRSPARGSPAELDDVILNLLLNAVEAMPAGGTITIATQAVDAGIQLTISDTGTGMAEETRRRVFEPFFTTRADVGSGLGLSAVHGIVTRWGGTIEVDSTPGEGTTFTLCLPVWREEVAPAQTPPAPYTGPEPAAGRVLVVEDDEDIRLLLERLLFGTCTVSVVGSGREALDWFEPGRCDVALIDLGMPDMAGDEVAAQMARLDPSLTTVLITGWSLPDTDPRRSRFDFHIQKPFDDLNQLEAVVARALELHRERARTDSRGM